MQAGNTSAGDPASRLQVVDSTAAKMRMILDAQGFLGIGEPTPQVRLHVNEAPNDAGELGALFRITGYEPTMQIEATRNATTWNIGANMSGTEDNGMRLNIGNNHMGTAVTINQVGRVGIGADNPTAKLEVAGQVKITGGAPGAGKVLTSDDAGLATWESPGAGSQGPQGKQGPAGADGAAGPVGSEFWTGDIGGDINNSNSGSVTVTPKLGIGYAVTPIHNTTLSVWQNGGSTKGNSRAVSLIDRDINPAAPYTEIGFGYEHSSSDRNMQPVVIGYQHTDFAGQGAGAFYIATRSSTSGEQAPIERIRVAANGNIGIGESDPQAMLHLRTGGPNTNIRLENTADTAGGAFGGPADEPLGTIEFASQIANMGYYSLNNPRAKITGVAQNASGGSSLIFYTANSTEVDPSERMRLYADGKLQLAVNGAYCDGSTWVNASSREAKKNIEPLSLDVALQTLGGLDPVTFEYKNSNTPDGHVGFIAEDVPEIVATPDRKGLAPMDIVGVLTAVVKEQQKLIEQQRADYESLKAKVEGTNVNN